MSDSPITEKSLARCRRDHAYLDHLLRRRGILAFDPETDAGKQVMELFLEFEAASNKRRDPAIRLHGIELAIEAVLLKRSIVTQLLRMGRVPMGDLREDQSKRQGFGMAVSVWKTCVAQFKDACGMMGIEGYADIAEVAENPADLKSVLATKAAQVQEAEFSAVGADKP